MNSAGTSPNKVVEPQRHRPRQESTVYKRMSHGEQLEKERHAESRQEEK